MRWFFLLTIPLLLPFAAAKPAQAQEVPPALVVRLRDVAGNGVVGVTVVIMDEGGATVLARVTSDPTGSAAFGPLPVADVRVLVQGRLANGTSLAQPGADAKGIAVTLGAPPVRLELRSEADGTVLPDPEVELSLEPGVAADESTALDPALLPPPPPASANLGATVAALPTVQTTKAPETTTPVAPARVEVAPTVPAASSAWPGLLLLGVLLLAVVTVLATQVRWGRL